MSHRAVYWAGFVVKLLCAIVIFFAFLFTVFTLGPSVEARLFPVVSKLTIVSLTADTDGNAVITAEFTKHRDCQYLGITWFHGKPDGYFSRATVILRPGSGTDDSGTTRPPGTQRSGPWVIGIPVDEIETNSFAMLSHQCHPFWVTTTDFYP